MIDQVSLLLKKILNDPALPDPLKSADKDFVRPTDPYSPAADTINLFLYDIRENADLRSNEQIVEKKNGQAIVHVAPMRVYCCYLVTAWVPGLPSETTVMREQLMLSQALRALARFPIIPEEVLQGTGLADQDPLLPMITAQADSSKSSSEFWASVGNKIRASINVNVTISIPALDDQDGFLVKNKFTNIAPGQGADEDNLLAIGGRILKGPGAGIEGALVDLTDAGLSATTDSDGRFSFPRVLAGTHTFRVVAVGFVPKTQSIVVPGRPEDYEITLAPLP
ncbi:MAG TPA: Pvc16 family protein [Blastocatellia bacterium]|nr:Pvc16 family protein [Blastocatellia bacterium]